MEYSNLTQESTSVATVSSTGQAQQNNGDVSVENADGKVVKINCDTIYKWSVAKRTLSLSGDRLKRAVKRNEITLGRKAYAFSSDSNEVKGYEWCIKGGDLVKIAEDDQINPKWDFEVSSEDMERFLS